MKPLDGLELKIAWFLRIGVIAAGVILLSGWLTKFKLNGNPFFNFQTYDQIYLTDLIQFHLKNKDWGVLLSYAGLVILILLPFIRVLLTSYLFIRQGEYRLALIAVAVLLGLIISMSLGINI